MSTARPFAYNTGSTISGTEQFGNLAVGVPTSSFESTGLKWWNGPDEELGYVIAHESPTGQPGADGETAYLGFWRTDSINTTEFVNLSNFVANKNGTPQNFTDGNVAKTWLESNGYWTSWQAPANGILTRAVGAFDTVTGSTIVTFSSSTFSISGSSFLPVFDGESKEFSHGDIEIGDTLTIGLTGTPFYTVALTKNSFTFFQQSFWYTPETGVTFNTAVSTGDTLTVSVAVRVDEYENPGIGSSSIQACSSYPTLSSSKYSVLPWGNWGSEAYIFNDSQFTSPFTSSYIANVGFGTSTVYWKETDSNGKVISQGTCPSSTPTPTITTTSTPTPTITPTNTPTPSTSPIPLTGYPFNLVALPYNFPSSGNSIMNGAGGSTSGSTNVNELSTSGRGFYFNSIDANSVDRTNYYSAFTGQSVTITLSQGSNTAIYSGDTNSFKQWIQAPEGSGFVFGTGIGAPPSGNPSGIATLIQSATTLFTIGVPVYVSLVINPDVTPTPTITTTSTPTPTITPTNTVTPTPSATPQPVNLLVYLDTGNSSSYPGTGNTWFDLVGASNDATLSNSPTYSSSNGGILQFDDTSLEYATIPDLGNLSQWTVEAWFKLSSSLTGKVASIVSNEFDLIDKLNFSIGTNNQPTNANLSVGFFDGTWRATTGFVPQVGVWYQVVGTYDGSVIRQYINGVASGGTVNYVGTPESGGEVRLMRRWDATLTASNLVDGDLSIVKIYNSALSAAEVLQNFDINKSRYGY